MYFYQVHTEREMDRVLGIEGIQLVGINNRDLGKAFLSLTKYAPISTFILLFNLLSFCLGLKL